MRQVVLVSTPYLAQTLPCVGRERTPLANILIPAPLDLAQPDNIRKFVEVYKSQQLPLHILVNNAGAAYRREWYTAEGVAGLVQVQALSLNHMPALHGSAYH